MPTTSAGLVFEVVEDAAIDGAVWVEPTLYLDSFAEVIGQGELVLEIVYEALRSARSRIGIGARLIVSANRDLGPTDAVRQARLAARGDPDVIGAFGLVNDELAYPVEDFAEALEIASGATLGAHPPCGRGHPFRPGSRRPRAGSGANPARHRRSPKLRIAPTPRRSAT